MQIWAIWLIIAGFFFILEIFTEGFLLCWFGVGSIVALGSSFLFPNIYLQMTIFLIISVILILSTRKLTDKIKPKESSTNVYTILGKKATVSQAIDSIKGQGQIKIDGDLWSAKSNSDEIILEGSTVEVLDIDGVKAVVKKI